MRRELYVKESSTDYLYGLEFPNRIKEYCDGVKNKVFIRIDDNDRNIGFASLKRNNEIVLEIYVMGINKEYHRNGIGKKLIRQISEYAKENGYKYLEVKTLDESRESEEYGTR